MKRSIRNRIVEHVTVRAGDLVPHPLNFRRHPKGQRTALADSLRELGDIRSLLGYRLPDGRIQLIDGHLRRDLDPNRTVTVEVVDLTEEEARQALLTLDPLAALAETDAAAVARLTALAKTDSEALRAMWQKLAQDRPVLPAADPNILPPASLEEKFLILIECADEQEQIELLQRFRAEGLTVKALTT
ncbi:MAG TPA: hypothetical protein VNK04_21095 [Gemmataceae bacterium]|jgi:predicted DNA-binding transcriptional regulator YafY|nr:hypothetical protein [Gemmataceae bacterium]